MDALSTTNNGPATLAPTRFSPAPGSARILVVDDNEIKRYTTHKILETAGYRVEEAGSAEEALDLLPCLREDGSGLPQIAILDVRLPGMDGCELCRRIKASPTTESILVLHLSGHRTGAQDRIAGLEAGGDGYVTLPVEPEVLLAYVRSLLRLSEAQRETRETQETLEARVAERTAALSGALSALEVGLAERQQMVRRLVNIQEEERRRISRELHDQMGQHLAAFSLGLRVLGDAHPEDTRLQGQLDTMRAITQDMSREVHRLAIELRPASLDDLGLEAALESHIQEWQSRTGIAALLEVTGFPDRLAPDIEETIYRVVQETLTNVAKHASPAVAGESAATRVSVTLQLRRAIRSQASAPGDPSDAGDADNARQSQPEVQVTIEDNGPGFDAEAAGSSGRLGLLGMRERVEIVGGTVMIESSPGDGAAIYVRIPYRGR